MTKLMIYFMDQLSKQLNTVYNRMLENPFTPTTAAWDSFPGSITPTPSFAYRNPTHNTPFGKHM